jgi:hypothetical protein
MVDVLDILRLGGIFHYEGLLKDKFYGQYAKHN